MFDFSATSAPRSRSDTPVQPSISKDPSGLFRVGKSLNGIGDGVFAMRPPRKWETIIEERPLMSLALSTQEVGDAERWTKIIYARWSRLNSDEKMVFKSLIHSKSLRSDWYFHQHELRSSGASFLGGLMTLI